MSEFRNAECGARNEDDSAFRIPHSALILTLILCAGAVLRGFYLHEIAAEPTFDYTVYDPQYNDYWARGLATGKWMLPPDVNDPEIQTTPHGRPPGYPYFLAAVYKLFGVNYLVPRLVQMTLGLVNILLLYLLGRRVFGLSAGLVAAGFCATYWVFIYYEGILTYPSVAIFLLLAMMLAIEKWQRAPGVMLALGMGFLFGLFGLFRPNGLLFGPVLVAWMLWVLHRRGMGFGKFLLSAACVTLATLAMLTPAAIRNYRVAHDFVFISSYGGLNFYAGNHEGACLTEPRIPGLRELAGIDNWCCFDYPAIVRGLAKSQGRDTIQFSEANRYFYRQAFDYIRAHPADAVLDMLKKAALFWGPAEITNDTMPALDKANSNALRWLPGFPWVAGLFALGLLAWFVERRDAPGNNAARWAILLFVIAYFLSVIPYFIAGRYRVPVTPFLLLFGAYGIVALARQLRAKRIKTAVAMVAVGGGALALAHWNVMDYQPNEATWHFRRAIAFEAHNDIPGAIAEYQAASALPGAPSAAAGNLGRLYMAQGQNAEARAAFARSLEIAPDDAATLNSLGYLLATEGNHGEAIAKFRAALDKAPAFTLARVNLGDALLAKGDAAAALEAFDEALEREPGSALPVYGKGRAYFAQGRYDEAVAAYRAAIEADPDFALAFNNLGYTLEQLGLQDKGREAYVEALRADPRCALARMNLGNLLMARQRYAEAYEHFAAVLRQFPGNAQAKTRLDEAAGKR